MGFLRSIWHNPYLVRERQSAGARRLVLAAVAATYVVAALSGTGAWLLSVAAQSPSGGLAVSAPPDHWLFNATPAQAFARGLVGAATLAIWVVGSGIAPVYAAIRRSREIVSGQADLVSITQLEPSAIAIGSILSSLLWILGSMAAAIPLLVLGHILGGDWARVVNSSLIVATLIVGAIARGAIGFVGAQRYARKGTAIVFACAIGWIAIPVMILLLWLFTAWTSAGAIYDTLGAGASPAQVEAAFWRVLRTFTLAAMSLTAVVAFAWAIRSSEPRTEPAPHVEGERPKVVIEGPRFEIERGPSLWKMGETDFERIVFKPEARKAADLPSDAEGDD